MQGEATAVTTPPHSPDLAMDDDQAYLFAIQITSGAIVPMALKAAIELDVLEILAAAGPSARLSAADIAARLPSTNPHAAAVLDRVLGFLASYSVLTCSVVAGDDGRTQRLYGLAPISKYLVRDQDGASIAGLVLLDQHRAMKESWFHLKEAILEGGIPFERAHGMSAFDYVGKDPELNKLFNAGMSDHSQIAMKKIVEAYNGFQELDELVDVGGGIGTSLNMVISKYPHIRGINFDLPHVVATAPTYPGIEHLGGDMLVSIPAAKNIFMKWVLHDWSDELCLKILKNCYNALPEAGKVIIAEFIRPIIPSTDLEGKCASTADMLMMAYNPGGKERTEKEFEALAEEAGFAGFKSVARAYNTGIIELHKNI